jgi:hypothetical protein
VVSRRLIASAVARSSSTDVALPARSTSVRVGTVTRSSSRTHHSSRRSSRARWTVIPARGLAFRPLTITSTTVGPAGWGSRFQTAAALRWLNTALRPRARSAAISGVRLDPTAPTRYTPRCSAVSRPALIRVSIAWRPTPAARSWFRATTPCWRAATLLIARSLAMDSPQTARSPSTRPRKSPLPPISGSTPHSSQDAPSSAQFAAPGSRDTAGAAARPPHLTWTAV